MVCIFHPVYPYECLSMAAATERNILEKKESFIFACQILFLLTFSVLVKAKQCLSKVFKNFESFLEFRSIVTIWI